MHNFIVIFSLTALPLSFLAESRIITAALCFTALMILSKYAFDDIICGCDRLQKTLLTIAGVIAAVPLLIIGLIILVVYMLIQAAVSLLAGMCILLRTISVRS